MGKQSHSKLKRRLERLAREEGQQSPENDPKQGWLRKWAPLGVTVAITLAMVHFPLPEQVHANKVTAAFALVVAVMATIPKEAVARLEIAAKLLSAIQACLALKR